MSIQKVTRRKTIRTPVRPLKPGETGVYSPGADPGPGAGIASLIAHLSKQAGEYDFEFEGKTLDIGDLPTVEIRGG